MPSSRTFHVRSLLSRPRLSLLLPPNPTAERTPGRWRSTNSSGAEYDEDEEVSAAVRAEVTCDSGEGLFPQAFLVDDNGFPPFPIPTQTGFKIAKERPPLQ